MSNPVANQRLERRLEFAGADFLATDATVAAYQTPKQRDVAAVLTPETAEKLALILLHARDEGRVANYAPIRNVRLAITLRANIKTAAGAPEALDAMTAAVEALLDDSNLTTSLDSLTRGVRVMKATRRPGIGYAVQGLIKLIRFEIEVACLRAENTTDGLSGAVDGAWVDGDGTEMVDGDGTSLVF